MTLLHASEQQVAPLRRLRRNAWAAIALCILFRIATALAGPAPAAVQGFELIPMEIHP